MSKEFDTVTISAAYASNEAWDTWQRLKRIESTIAFIGKAGVDAISQVGSEASIDPEDNSLLVAQHELNDQTLMNIGALVLLSRERFLLLSDSTSSLIETDLNT